MSALKLIIGNRTFSSWSMRGWLSAALSGLAFEVEVVWLDEPGYKRWLVHRTGGAGTVPTLVIRHGAKERFIADSAAISEYFADRVPEAGFWPQDIEDRAEARSLAARMHSGFSALRQACPMNLSNRFNEFDPSDDVREDLSELERLWNACLERKPDGGPFLFGAFGAVDIAFAPVATRVYTFNLPVTGLARAYVDAVLHHPLVQRWVEASEAEAKVTRERTGRLSEGMFAAGNYPILKLYA